MPNMSVFRSDYPPSPEPWQQQLSDAFTDIERLCGYLGLTSAELPIAATADRQFPMRVPLSFARRMEKGNPDDPLLRQVLPVQAELRSYPGFNDDPVGDLAAVRQPGLLHKYQGRVLLINTGACAINCRYCFRRNFPYADLQLNKQAEQAAIAYIASDASIGEVILSGGDPLLLNDARLSQLLTQLAAIAHVKRIRIHSRLPIVLPARITWRLVDTLAACGKPLVMVTHCNHGHELDDEVSAACRLLKSYGFTLLNQAVLLKEVNDNTQTLCALSERLFEFGIMPYYLHLLDRAQGTGHFEVPEAEALNVYRQLQTRLPGYLVPRLVRELSGAKAKLPVG